MTDQQINWEIALVCGWIYYDGWHHPDGKSELPNYCNDLNAMHEAEKTLWPMEPIFLSTYCELLMKSRYPSEWGSAWGYIHATARQRAEAFLRTIGKWKEESK